MRVKRCARKGCGKEVSGAEYCSTACRCGPMPAAGTLDPYHETMFTISCGDYHASANTTPVGWLGVDGHRRSWFVRGPGDTSFSQNAGFDWAANRIWRLANGFNPFGPLPDSDQDRLDAWLDGQRVEFETFKLACARLAGDEYTPALPRPPEGAELGTVYLIGALHSDVVKIGFTDGDPADRARKLQTGSPVRLRVLSWFAGTAEDERGLHRRLRHLRSRGEWFRNTNELRSVFALLVRDRASLG